MPLTGDARRWRILDEMKFRREREYLQGQMAGLNLAIMKARKIRDPFERKLALAQLHRTFALYRSDWATAKAREASARRDLGEA